MLWTMLTMSMSEVGNLQNGGNLIYNASYICTVPMSVAVIPSSITLDRIYHIQWSCSWDTTNSTLKILYLQMGGLSLRAMIGVLNLFCIKTLVVFDERVVVMFWIIIIYVKYSCLYLLPGSQYFWCRKKKYIPIRNTETLNTANLNFHQYVLFS